MAQDLKLDPATHDLVIEDYDLVGVGGVDEVAQHLRIALRMFMGEWYLDEAAGMPYWRDILISAPNIRAIEALFRREILSVPEVESLSAFNMVYDRSARQLTVTFSCVTSEGEVSSEEVF